MYSPRKQNTESNIAMLNIQTKLLNKRKINTTRDGTPPPLFIFFENVPPFPLNF